MELKGPGLFLSRYFIVEDILQEHIEMLQKSFLDGVSWVE